MNIWMKILLSVLLICSSNHSVAEQTSATVIPSEYFGMHFFYTAADIRWPGEPSTQIPESVKSWRLWDAYGTQWRQLEPVRGHWDFRYLDRYIEQAQSNGTSLVLTLGQTPAWASARPSELTTTGTGNAAEPANLNDWENYVRTVATRYRGKIYAYEIWNEPAFKETDNVIGKSGKAGFFSGDAKSMVLLAKTAAKVIREVDPQAKIVSPSMAGQYQGIKRLDAFLAAGGGEYVDVVGFHFYLVDSFLPEDLPAMVAKLKSLMKRYGIDSKPLWNTESGLMIQGDGPRVDPQEPNGKGVLSHVFTDDKAAAFLARFMVLGKSAGLDRFYWFAWDSGSMGLLNPGKTRVKNRAGKAFLNISRWLSGFEMKPCQKNNDAVWTCELDNPLNQKHALLVWTSGNDRKIKVQPGYFYYERLLGEKDDLSANVLASEIEIGATPILLKAEPLPWTSAHY